jgi:uncharacterized protein (UPF0262 family)
VTHLIDIRVQNEGVQIPPSVAQDRAIAISDLLEENRFDLPARGGVKAPPGPYRLTLAVRDHRLVFEVYAQDAQPITQFHLSFGPFRQVLKDYDQIREAYTNALNNLPPAQVEAIDMARRGIHNEGARVMMERLEGKADVDMATARRLFTLISILQGGR